MPHRLLSRGSIIVATAVAIAACSSSNSQTSAASAPQPSASMSMASALPAGVTPQMIAQGDSAFHASTCVRCHGADAKGRPNGPDLTDTQWSQISGTYAEIVQTITDGVPKEKVKLSTAQFGMRARGGANLTDDQIKIIAAYVYSISHH